MSGNNPLGNIDTCKWCNVSRSEKPFEGVQLCSKCYDKATSAVAHPTLCIQCSKLFTDEEVMSDLLSENGYHHSDAKYLMRSCEQGCALCRMLWLQDPNPDANRLNFIGSHLHAETVRREKGDLSKRTSSHDINLLYFSSEEGQYRLDLSVSTSANNPAASFISQRLPSKDLGDEQTNCTINNWVKECLSEHQQCQHIDPPNLPTRVVDVGVSTESNIKLLEPPRGTKAGYLTLSYCWGRPRFLVTLNENIEQHREGVEIERLPQTFRDAIKITRELGFRYIWIDALCIIQDSSEDKANEIGQMGSIYNESTLTIGVVAAETVAEGFLKTKPVRYIDTPYKCAGGEMGSVRISVQKEVDLWNEWLFTRAWCLQENFLSQRLLLYTDSEVIWQCETVKIKRNHTTHVSYVRENPTLGSSPFNRVSINMLKSPINNESDSRALQSLDGERYNVWRSIVGNYTRRNLTVASDRLPALAGVAQKLQEVWHDKYILGIWERQLLPSIAWQRDPQLQDTKQPYYARLSEYRAPSWSWASIDGPVQFDTRFDLGNARGMGAKVSISTEEGSNESDSLVVDGHIVSVQDMLGRSSSHQGHLCLDDHSEESKWPFFADNFESSLSEEDRQSAFCLLLGEGKSGSGKMMKTVALVMLRTKDTDQFQRIGLWESTVNGASKIWVGGKNRKTIRLV